MMQYWMMAEKTTCVVGFIAVAAILFVEILKHFNEWWYNPKLKDGRFPVPPGKMGWPILGNMLAFLHAFKSGHPDSFIAKHISMYNRIGLYKAFMFGHPTVFATTPESCKFTFMNDDIFTNGWPKSKGRILGYKSLSFLGPQEHKRLRRLTSTLINGDEVLSKYVSYVERFSKIELESWSKKDQIILLKEMLRLMLNIIAGNFLSLEPGCLAIEVLQKDFRDLNLGLRSLGIMLPGTSFNKAVKARRRIVDLLQKEIDDRRMVGDSKNDMLQDLMSLVDEEGKHLTDEEIIDVLAGYVNAGHESSAHACIWTIYFLQKNPRVYQKLIEEHRRIREKKKPQEPLTLADCRSMTYLSKVVDETLRIVNIAPMAFRLATRDVVFNGYTIPKGWHVQPWMRHVHLDAEVYPDPLQFNPDRWENFSPRPGMFIPFGGGKRLCPGKDLAKLEISVFIHILIVNYKVELLYPDGPVQYLPHPMFKNDCPARITKLQSDIFGLRHSIE